MAIIAVGLRKRPDSRRLRSHASKPKLLGPDGLPLAAE
ncbi:hypothetical protein KL86PLE_100131 [uncultured Pleomorphomonas sp.]|uniref:Uncharacterized protein n=1 Tax=uncultured Pleomorphomonas sp. TaxID=442121 RepID=A0A212L1Y9_9HYPH|nr:hypothetical protein KL86PLE_100131 [uncultured Pleomorphomonas sp.]